jgi:hypothetical protein
MKISITDKFQTVAIEVPADTLTGSAMVEQLFRPAMLALGFSEKTINEALGDIDDDAMMEMRENVGK